MREDVGREDAIPTRDDMVDIGGKAVLRFHPTHKKIKDGVPRCVGCGQIDEPEWHEAKWCPLAGGWLPFPTSTLKAKLKADSGYGCEVTARLTLEQWVLINRIIDTPDKIARSIVDQDGNSVGVAYSTVKDLLKVEAYVDDAGTAWTPPTAWAYFAACRANGSESPSP